MLLTDPITWTVYASAALCLAALAWAHYVDPLI